MTTITKSKNRDLPDAEDRLQFRIQRFHAAEATDVRDEITCILLDETLFHARLLLAAQFTKELLTVSDQAHFPLGTTSDYLRELWWIATGQLDAVLREGIANRSSLALMTMNADVLPIARKMFDEGVTAFESDLAALMRIKQGDTWSWLRDEVNANRLQSFALDKYVATWKREVLQDEIVLADSPVEAQRMAESRWRIPGDMIAVTLVESLFD